MRLLISFQCASVPAFGLSRASSNLRDKRQLVAGLGCPRSIAQTLIECQACAVAPFGLDPLALFLCHSAQLIPYLCLLKRLFQFLKSVQGCQIARLTRGIVVLCDG